MTTAIIVAAGKSERMGGTVDKAFLSLGSKPVIAYSLMAFDACPDIDEIVMVVRKEQLLAAKGVIQMFGGRKVAAIVAGGATRQASVSNGLAAANPDTRIVCVHDGARPCIKPPLISETIQSAKRVGSGIAATKVTDTVKQVDKGQVVTVTLDRAKVWTVQTPQTFKFNILQRALAHADAADMKFTDEASAVEFMGESVHLVSTTFPNIKITHVEDIKVASLLLGIQ